MMIQSDEIPDWRKETNHWFSSSLVVAL